MARLYIHDTQALATVDWEPKIAVLDQEDLHQQGIKVSQLVEGAPDVDALGDCTANATTAALSNLLPQDKFFSLTGCTSYGDTISAEKFAIVFYHSCTDLTGTPAQEWPPNDAGSSGPYIVKELQQQGLVSGDQLASGATNMVSLMQQGGLLAGIPFLNAWESPGPDGFVDGDGSAATLKQQIAEGVAGGHEIFLSAIEKVTLLGPGHVDPNNTVVRFRNSWGAGWADNGSARFHLSTLIAFSSQADFRLLVAA